MELNIVAQVQGKGVDIVQSRIRDMKLRRNFTFLPHWFITQVIDTNFDELEIVKELITADWGVWTPQSNGQDFIQSQANYLDNGRSYHIVLTRSHEDYKTVYLLKNTSHRYHNGETNACVALRVTDLDDDSNWSSNDIPFEYLDGVMTLKDNTWQLV